jgi:hypothetical protein
MFSWLEDNPMIGSSLVGGVGSLLGGIFGAIGQSQSNRARGRQAAAMDPFIEQLMALGEQIGEGGDYGGLRGQASRELTAGSNALNAQLAQRGIYNSGTAMSAQRGLTADVMSQLAGAINADKLARSQIELGTIGTGLNTIASSPGYGYFDRETGKTQGK